MHVMMRRRVVPAGQRILCETLRIQLESEMAEHVQEHHKAEKSKQRVHMQREEHDGHWKYARLKHRFKRVKGKSGPRRGVGRLMMNEMNAGKDLRMMHQ